MNIARLCLAAVLLSSCQCLVPVDDDDAGLGRGAPDSGMPDSGMPDSGMLDGGGLDGGTPDSGVADGGTSDAGRDAGTMDGGGAECVRASDCQSPLLTTRFCQAAAKRSCVVGRCVTECSDLGPRECLLDAGSECLECSRQSAPLCPAETCRTNAFVASISEVVCRPGVTAPLQVGDTLSFVPVRGASCLKSVSTPAGGLGQVYDAPPSAQAWFIRALGGWCLGERLSTGAVRSLVSCPACNFVIEGF